MHPTPYTWKEARRLRAWRLKQQGWSQRQIAEAVGVSEGAVSQWMKRAREAGLDALRRRPPPGAPRRLSIDQLARLPERLHQGPIAYGFRGELWYARDQLSAIGAISPEGKVYFHSQDRPINSDDAVGFLEHLLGEVPGRMVIIWDGAPIHRSHVIQQFLARGAAQRLHVERLPAYAPERNPGKGLWQQLKGVELRNVCCFNIPHLTHEVRHAVKRVSRKLRLITSFFRGAKL